MWIVFVVWLIVALLSEAADYAEAVPKDRLGHVMAWFWPVILLLWLLRGLWWLLKEIWRLSANTRIS